VGHERRWGHPVVVLLMFLGACDPMVRYVVTRRAAIGVDCPDAARDFVITRKLSCCPDRKLEATRGRITFGANEDLREVEGASDVRLKHSSEYLEVIGGVLGSEEDWARLQMTCPSTGAVVFDSGEVRSEDAFCKQGKQYMFFFEGRVLAGCPR
jgi:hypothetical protein